MPHDELAMLGDGVRGIVVNPGKWVMKTVTASGKAIPCFRTFALAFSGSQRNLMAVTS